MFGYSFSTVLIFSLCILLVNCSDDNQNRRQRRSPEEQASTLQEALNLTDEQTKEIEKIYVDAREEMRLARENFNGDRSKMRARMMEFSEKIDQRIKEVLNEEQVLKYEKYREEQRERLRERRRERD
jgi:hypothetical protein